MSSASNDVFVKAVVECLPEGALRAGGWMPVAEHEAIVAGLHRSLQDAYDQVGKVESELSGIRAALRRSL